MVREAVVRVTILHQNKECESAGRQHGALPACWRDPFGRLAGNDALTTPRQMLLCRERREYADWLASRIEHVRLSEGEGFSDLYVERSISSAGLD